MMIQIKPCFDYRLFIAAFLVSCSQKPVLPTNHPNYSFPYETRIKNLVKLTSSGSNAEAYWSNDGKWLTFQHKGDAPKYPENEQLTAEKQFFSRNKNTDCDQIFKIKVDGSKITSVSNGEGRTTCSFFFPDDSRISYSSTYAHGPQCPPKPDMSKGYVWPVYNIYQFYSSKADGSDLKPMENGVKPSYNAEMVSCHDGSVVFTSNRDGDLEIYSGKLNKNAEIENVKRLTHEIGYDGGPVFSPDCKKITWRAHRPKNQKEIKDYQDLLQRELVKPGKLEIWVANIDGSDARQITNLNAASFAPAFSPDGSHIIFASNVNDPKGRMQDLFYVAIDGSGLEQITYSHSFDAFPMFSPDGKKLAFASNRFTTGHGQTNIYVADWVQPTDKLPSTDSISAIDRFQAHIQNLSAPEMEGRAAGTVGLQKAEAYVSKFFKKIGLKPISSAVNRPFKDSSFNEYFQTVEIQTGLSISESHLKFNDTDRSKDSIPAPFSSNGNISGEVVDVGYGLVAPEKSVDDYESKDVRGKWALVQRHAPKELGLTIAQERNYSNPRFKTFLAREKGAIGILLWEDEPGHTPSNSQEDLKETFDTLARTGTQNDAGITALFINRELANDLASQANSKILASVKLNRVIAPAQNIVGVTGSSCGKTEPIVIGAHLDHLGHGAANSLEPSKSGVHYGADDNASGIAGLLEVASLILGKKGCYILVAFTGEEVGVIGSSQIVESFKKNHVPIKAMLNMDMIGRMNSNTVIAFGTESAGQWNGLLNLACRDRGIKCIGSGDGYGPSDHMPFYLADIPVLHFFTGSHSDYHRVSDTPEKINALGGATIGDLVAEIALQASNTHFKFQKNKSSGTSLGRLALNTGDQRSFGAYLGTIPDYTENSNIALSQENAGVKLSGARPGSPADKAGIQKGDRLTEIILMANQKLHKIQNLEDFMFVLTSLKPDDKITLGVNREGKKILLAAIVGKRTH